MEILALPTDSRFQMMTFVVEGILGVANFALNITITFRLHKVRIALLVRSMELRLRCL